MSASAGPSAGLRATAVDPDDFPALFAAAPTALLVMRPDPPAFTLVAVTDAFLRLAGRRREEVVGQSLFDAFPDANPGDPAPTGEANMRASLETVLRTGVAHEMPLQRYDVRRPDGAWEERYWAPCNSPVFGADGAVRYLVQAVEEVTTAVRAQTERARLVAELAAERERLRAVILQMPTPVALHEGPELRFTLANAAFTRASGGRDVVGLTPREAFPELAGQGFHERIAHVYATGEPWLGAETPVLLDGDGAEARDTWFDLRYEPVRDSAGQVTGVLQLGVDVTEQVRARREAEALLAESRAARADAEEARAEAERAAQITNRVTTHLADGVCLMDAHGRLTYMNPAAERSLGWTEAELVGDLLHERVHYLHPDGSPYPMAECPLGQVLAEARPVLGLADQWIRKDGSFVHVVTTCSPILGEGGVVGAVLSLHDDTERRLVEADRERLLADAQVARAAAEAASRAKGEFLAVMSHELRTPLNAIGGYTELIEMGIHGPVSLGQRTALERIQRSQRALLSVINEVLNYTRLETGAVTYDLTAVPVAEAVGAAEVLVAPQLRAKGLDYACTGCDPALAVHADRDKLQQVLLNLLSNAIKFTEARDGRPGRLEVTCATDPAASDRVVVRVRDTGIGIATDKLGAVFEPFVQVDQRLTREQSGTGLGLAISRDLARGMGGDLTVESTPGVGSTFTLTLPRA